MNGKFEDPIGASAFMLNGQELNIAHKVEMWASMKIGGSFAIASVKDLSTDLWDFVQVVDYKGNTYDMEDLTDDSQQVLAAYICDELF